MLLIGHLDEILLLLLCDADIGAVILAEVVPVEHRCPVLALLLCEQHQLLLEVSVSLQVGGGLLSAALGLFACFLDHLVLCAEFPQKSLSFFLLVFEYCSHAC